MQPDSTSTRPEDKKTSSCTGVGCGILLALFVAVMGYALWSSSREMHQAEADLATTIARPAAPTPTTKQIEAAYVTFVGKQSGIMADSLRRIAALAANPRFTDAWIISVAAETVTWQMVRDEVAARHAPAQYMELHHHFRQSLDHIVTAGDLLGRGIDERDATLIDAATAELKRGTTAIEDATGAINAHR